MNNRWKEMQTETGIGRRKLLGLIGAAAAVSLVGDLRAQPGPVRGLPERTPAPTAAGAATPCVVRPEQTEGPYFVDEQLNRSDVRSDPTDGTLRPGTPLRLAFRVSRVAGNSCSPLAGAIVDIWQCDALGVYSAVQDFSGLFDTRGKKFLRGYQVTDTGGVAQFVTIYPGWYPGRTVHIHFKIRTAPAAPRGLEFTSQLYFDDAVTDQVHALAPYAGKGRRNVRNDRDGIFRRAGGGELLLPLVPEAQGYAGTFDIALRTSAA